MNDCAHHAPPPVDMSRLSHQGAAAGKSVGGGSGKLDPVQQLLAIYEAALNHLRAQGALLNTVKPEYLLPEGDFSKLMEDRCVCLGGWSNHTSNDFINSCSSACSDSSYMGKGTCPT